MAWSLFLALFPVLLTLMALTGLIGGEAAFRTIMGWLRTALPPSGATLLETFVRDVTDTRQPGALSLGIVLTVWAASGGFVALGDGMNRMYDLEQGRSWWRQRVVAFVLAFAASLVLAGGAVVLVAGPELFGAIGMGAVWSVLRWPAAFLLAALFFWLLLTWLPARDQSRARLEVLAGAVTGTIVWVAATALFRLYVADVASYNATYGFVGSIIVLMLWIYLTALAALLGTEIAAVLEARRRGFASGDLSALYERRRADGT